MSSPIFNMFGRQQQAAQNGGFANLFDFIQKFSQFNATFSGDPRAQVEQLIQKKGITQEQLNQAAQLTNMVQPILHKHI